MEFEIMCTLLIIFISTGIQCVISLENVTLGKQTTQISSHGYLNRAENCVDGDSINTVYGANGSSCCHTIPSYQNKPAWWRVDLGQEFDVYEVVLYNVYHFYELPDRFHNTWIIVSNDEQPTPNGNTVCNKVINGMFAVITKECDYGDQPAPRRGRYIVIQRDQYSTERSIINMCEVLVYSCSPGYWGIAPPNSNTEDCSLQCHCKNGSTCRVEDGFCYNRCEENWWGTACNKQCQCSSGNVCDSDTGDCGSYGCAEGYYGKNCFQELPKLSSRPDLRVDNEGFLTIAFSQWTRSQGGSGPVASYRIEKQQHGSEVWETVFDIPHVANVNIVKSGITGLLADTYYRFRVVPLVEDCDNFVDGIPSKPSEFVNTDGQTLTNGSDESSSNIGLIAGAAVGGVILIIVMVIVVVIVCMRNRRSRDGNNCQMRTTESTEQGKGPFTPNVSVSVNAESTL